MRNGTYGLTGYVYLQTVKISSNVGFRAVKGGDKT